MQTDYKELQDLPDFSGKALENGQRFLQRAMRNVQYWVFNN